MQTNNSIRAAETTLRERGHVVRLLGREEPAEGTVALRFTRPSAFRFRAGQHVELTLPMDDGSFESRTLSIASAPADDELVFAARRGPSPFKQALATVPAGTAAHLEGPYGSLVLQRATQRDVLFVAGGIGITPFRSMLRQAASDRDPRRFTLVYSNARPGTAAWLAELQQLERDWDPFRLVATMTGLEASEGGWAGERRAIGATLIADAASPLRSPIFYLAGPPAMVAAIRDALAAAGVDDDDVRGEEFFGYEHAPEAA